MAHALVEREIDVALTWTQLEEDAVASNPWHSLEGGVAVPIGHTLADAPSATAEQLSDDPLMMSLGTRDR